MLQKINFSVLLLSLIFISSCKKDEAVVTPTAPVVTNVTFKAALSGANEPTPNASTATGTATLTFNTTTKIFSVVVNYSGTTATIAHIHRGLSGTSGGVVFGFPNPIASPINYASVALDAMQEFELNSNAYYVNIHSTAFPAGEIRGQLIKQ